MIDLVILDCDGVLVDSEVLSAEVLIAELAAVGITVDRAYVRDHCLGHSFPKVARNIRNSFAVPLPEDFEARYRRSLLARFETELRTTPHLLPVLDTLAIPTCVATSSSRERVSRSLQVAGLDGYFGDRVFTASQVKNGKPAPDLLLFAAERMGYDPARTAVVEDSLPGLLAADAAGMHVLAYTGASHLGGRAPETPFPLITFDDWRQFPALLAELGDRAAS